MSSTVRSACIAALAAALLLEGCGERRPAEPQSLSQAQAPDAAALDVGPDTRVMGAGSAGAGCGIRGLQEDMLRRINAARAAGRQCGGRPMPPALPLAWDPSLQSAATWHSADMANRNYLSHRSPNGTDVRQRVSASKYPWKAVAENLAGGDATVAGVVRAWLDSHEHCANIMDPGFDEVAVACQQRDGTELGTYWTMVLARKN